MPVSEASEGQLVQVNHIYVIPPNKFLAIRDGRLLLTAIPEPRGRQYVFGFLLPVPGRGRGGSAIGIVLSGTGNHRALGLKEIKLAGGMAMVQQPNRPISTRCPQAPSQPVSSTMSYTPEKMPEALIKYVRQPYLSSDPDEAQVAVISPELLNRILVLLRIARDTTFAVIARTC